MPPSPITPTTSHKENDLAALSPIGEIDKKDNPTIPKLKSS